MFCYAASHTRTQMQEGGRPRFSLADVSPVLNELLQKLFAAFSLPDSRENEYLMRCVTRVIVFVGPEVRWGFAAQGHFSKAQSC